MRRQALTRGQKRKVPRDSPVMSGESTDHKTIVLLDELLTHTLRLAGGVLAGSFLQGTPSAYALRGHSARKRLLSDLLDAHEMVASAAHPAGAYGQQAGSSAVHDFTVGHVLLSNDQQGCSVREQLLRLDQAGRFAVSSFGGVDAYE